MDEAAAPKKKRKSSHRLRKVNPENLELQRERLKLLEKKQELREGLPHLYGWKWYPWAREFFESTNKLNFLCAANQISKSSTQIRKCIDWATNPEKWPLLWRQKPSQFWYLYPSGNVATIEFETKWKLFLPRGKYKAHPLYGWKEEKKSRDIWAIHFNSGVHVYFKTYSQDAQNLQTGTVDAVWCDEELPIELYDELIFRLAASDGYFHMVFTATLGQEFWKAVLEGRGEEEKLSHAWKKQVSMFDCQKYDDGTDSHWTTEKIQQAVDRCQSQAEILRRVFGKFVVDAGRTYPAFDMKHHVKPEHHLPAHWKIYSAVDYGSGGEKGHPSAIVFIAVSPDNRSARAFLGWRGDKIETTADDLMKKYIELRGTMQVETQYYDQACRDFGTIAQRIGEPFLPAEKSHAIGEPILNGLFKNDMLFIYGSHELMKLAGELSTLQKTTLKNKAKDDFIDALRYCVAKVPWDWTFLTGGKPEGFEEPEEELTEAQRQIRERRRAFEEPEDPHGEIEREFAEANESYEL